MNGGVFTEQVLQKVAGRVSPEVNTSVVKWPIMQLTWKEERKPAEHGWPLGKEQGGRTG